MPEKRKYADRAAYIIKAVAKRRKKIREMAVKYKGGKCEICGYDKCIQAIVTVSCTPAYCSFHEKSWMKNGVKSVEPKKGDTEPSPKLC